MGRPAVARIRRAVPADAPAIAALHVAVWRERLVAPDARTAVADPDDDGKIVGFARARQHAGDRPRHRRAGDPAGPPANQHLAPPTGRPVRTNLARDGPDSTEAGA